MRLSPPEIQRYSRHLLLPGVGIAGQERLKNARLVCIGAGGLGCPVLLYLAAAGVGRIVVVDHDQVEESNLQRQVLFTKEDVGRKKAIAAVERLRERNPFPEYIALTAEADASNLQDIVALADVVVDTTDRYESRYLINDACVLGNKPLVSGALFRFDGQVSVFVADGAPCYRCLFADAPPSNAIPSCADGGVFGVTAGLVAMQQASEVLKLLLGVGKPLTGTLLYVDSLNASFTPMEFQRRSDCAVCGANPTITTLVPIERNEIRDPRIVSVQPDQFDEYVQSAVLLDVREAHEAPFGYFPGAQVIAASDLERHLESLAVDRRYIVGCRVGARSRIVARKLLDAGFKEVAHLEGGFIAYDALVGGFQVV